MSSPPRPPRHPYWTLPALVLVVSMPLSWTLVLGALAVAVRVTVALAGRAAAQRTEQRAAAARGDVMALGTDERGRTVTLEERQLAAHGLIVGASGAGKSTTLLGILGEHVARGRPVVAIDLKGSPAFGGRLQAAAQAAGRPMRIWTPEGPVRWNPLAVGDATELKDKLIATERFSEPHYQRAAERYVQSVIQVLHAHGREADLGAVVTLMEPPRLAVASRRLESALGGRVQDYLASLTRDQLSAVRGLGTRLALLSEGTAGPFLAGEPERGTGGPTRIGTPGQPDCRIDLRRALEGDEVVLFSLNSSRYGQLAAQLGTLAIQDLVSATGHRLQSRAAGAPPSPLAIVAVDEFSALGSDQVLALLARGREAGVSVLLATQELADLERAGRGFRDQVLGLTALKIAHRQDVPGSARTIAEMAGREWVWEQTHVIPARLGGGPRSRGTRRAAERLIVSADEITRLATGQVVMLSKTPEPRVTRVRVVAGGDPAAPRARTGSAPPRRGRPGRDQADPGVTR